MKASSAVRAFHREGEIKDIALKQYQPISYGTGTLQIST
jgi:hypothetical protein